MRFTRVSGLFQTRFKCVSGGFEMRLRCDTVVGLLKKPSLDVVDPWSIVMGFFSSAFQVLFRRV